MHFKINMNYIKKKKVKKIISEKLEQKFITILKK